MTLNAYRPVLALPGVPRLLAFSVVARMPIIASSLATTLYVVLGMGLGYGAAGLVAASSTIGAAVGGPWRGRTVDRLGLRRSLVPSVLVQALFWGSVPFLGYRALLAAAFVGGVMTVPIFNVVRQALAAVVPQQHQRAAFALDSIGTELSFMVAPALAVLLATRWSPTGSVVFTGVTTVLSGVGLMLLNPRTAADASPSGPSGAVGETGGTRGRRLWSRPAVLTPAVLRVLLITFGAVLVLGGSDISAVADLRASGDVAASWMFFVAWSVASIVGGLVFGAVRRPLSPAVLLVALGLLTVPVGLVSGAGSLSLAILPAGFVCAPVLTATAALVSRLVPADQMGEAMGWYGAAMTVGLALGSPLAGAAIDGLGPWAGFAAVGGVGVLVAALALLVRPVGTASDGATASAATAPAVEAGPAPSEAGLVEPEVPGLVT
jgi:MFS family permease